MEEFNQRIEGFAEKSEYNSLSTNAEGKEYNGVAEYSLSGVKKKKARGSRVGPLSAAAIAVVTFVSVFLFPSATAEADIIDLYASDTEIIWNVNVEKSDVTLKIVAYNDFTHRETVLSEGENSGLFTGLKENMQYSVAVCYKSGFGEKVLEKRKIYTKKSIRESVSSAATLKM